MKNTSIDLLLQATEIAARRMLTKWETEAVHAAALFHKRFPALLKTSKHETIDLLRETYQATAFFPDKALTRVLLDLGFSHVLEKNGLRWFIEAADILREFERIKKDGFVQLLWFYALVSIKGHLDTKINVTILQWGGYTTFFNDKLHATKVKADLYKLYRRIHPETMVIARSKGDYDNLRVDLLNWVRPAFGDFEAAKKALLQLSDGNTKKTYLRGVVDSVAERLESDAFYRSFYDLFSLIDPDLELPSADAYDDLRHDGVQFPSFQAKKIREIVN